MLKQLLKKLLLTPDKPKDGPSQKEGPSNPFGKFVSEETRKTNINVPIEVVVHEFEKGHQVTILNGDRRMYQQFLPKEKGELYDYDEEELDGTEEEN